MKDDKTLSPAQVRKFKFMCKSGSVLSSDTNRNGHLYIAPEHLVTVYVLPSSVTKLQEACMECVGSARGG